MKYEIAIGLPSLNEADRIGFVTRQIDKGISDFYNPNKAVIINFDCGSLDNTKKNFLNTKTNTRKQVFDVKKGKGRALIEFWKFAKSNDVPFIATIDSDLFSITPEWIYQIIQPLKDEKAEVILPLYARNRFKANITNQFAYPIILSAFGIEVRQPLAGEFGYSQKFYHHLLEQNKYLPTYKYGIDIFISSHALAGNFQIFSPDLKKKVDKPSFYHQEKTFLEVCQSALLTINDILLDSERGLIKPKNPILENKNYCAIDNDKLFTHKKHIPTVLKKLEKQFLMNNSLNHKYLKKDLIKSIKKITSKEYAGINEKLWSMILSQILIPCFKNKLNLIQAQEISRVLLPIYRWRVINFWLTVEKKSAKEAEKIITQQARLIQKKIVYGKC